MQCTSLKDRVINVVAKTSSATNANSVVNNHHAGFGLIDVLVATLLFSVTLIGLMRYQQVLIFQFHYYAESQHSWRLAHQLLDIYPQSPPELPAGWHFSTIENQYSSLCKIRTAKVASPKGAKAELMRWHCVG